MKRFDYSTVNSTMDTAREIEAKVEINSSAIIVAKEQTAGRGQSNRKWSNSGDGIYLTIISKYSENINLNGFSLFIGTLLINTFSKFCINTYLKWPNDILSEDGSKLSGILVETYMKSEQVILTGIGINFSIAPKLETKSIAVEDLTKEQLTKDDIINALINLYESNITTFKEKGFSFYQKKWNENNYYKDKRIQFEVNNKLIEGTCLGADSIGRLVLELSGKQENFLNGRIKS